MNKVIHLKTGKPYVIIQKVMMKKSDEWVDALLYQSLFRDDQNYYVRECNDFWRKFDYEKINRR